METTIKDVAKYAGVGVGTVSRVINNEKAVGAKTREKVLEAMKALNYSRNNMAFRLRKNETKIIALLVPVIDHPFFAKLAKSEGQAVLGRQHLKPTPWLTERHGYDPTLFQKQYGVSFEKKRNEDHSSPGACY